MPFRPHSGFVVLICPDPAYHAHWYDILTGGSQLEEAIDALLRFITEKNGKVDPDQLLQLAVAVSDLRSGGTSSRMSQIIQEILDHPLNGDNRIPHIVRVAGPASVVGDHARTLTCISENVHVLAGAHTILAEGHSDCFDVRCRHSHLYTGDQYHLQAGFLQDGGQRFANHHAVVAAQKVTFMARYTRFGSRAEVLATEDIGTFTALAPAA